MEKQVSHPFVRIAAASKLRQLFSYQPLFVGAASIIGIIQYDTLKSYLINGLATHSKTTNEEWFVDTWELHKHLPIYELVLEDSAWRAFGFDNAYVLAHPDSRETIAHLQNGTAQHLRDFAVILEHAPRLLRLVQKELEQSNVEAEHSRKKSRLERGRE